MSFETRFRGVTTRVMARTQRAFVAIGTAALDSIREGSPLTGAPGQPVDHGDLWLSWHLSFPTTTLAEITGGGPAAKYAEAVEDAIGPYGPVVYGAEGKGRSTRGGSHSVKLTAAGIGRIVDDEVAKAAR